MEFTVKVLFQFLLYGFLLFIVARMFVTLLVPKLFGSLDLVEKIKIEMIPFFFRNIYILRKTRK